MLKGLDPVLGPDLLWILAAMGHGDDLAVVDANHPAERIAAATASKRLVRVPGLTMARVLGAILTLLPLDDFEASPVRRMAVVGDDDAIPLVQREVAALLASIADPPPVMAGLERFAFYAAAESAFAVVQVGDPRPYGCFLLRKGVIAAP
ncbi:RbsD/FucU family protein [Phreatobacter cathodiphilus]|uniref:Fucose-binding protein n=1 Tax=Phreatobacter cathodiphilus TaxID=1868589 RepID=A0A2S0N876_9HYPH|nr:RbsD/FucU domain-containing protein [Phreatobacter cathodiphilus]AVO44370.1 fucose-binding protein [Phreatobacter cathodiphilus]